MIYFKQSKVRDSTDFGPEVAIFPSHFANVGFTTEVASELRWATFWGEINKQIARLLVSPFSR